MLFRPGWQRGRPAGPVSPLPGVSRGASRGNGLHMVTKGTSLVTRCNPFLEKWAATALARGRRSYEGRHHRALPQGHGWRGHERERDRLTAGQIAPVQAEEHPRAPPGSGATQPYEQGQPESGPSVPAPALALRPRALRHSARRRSRSRGIQAHDPHPTEATGSCDYAQDDESWGGQVPCRAFATPVSGNSRVVSLRYLRALLGTSGSPNTHQPGVPRGQGLTRPGRTAPGPHPRALVVHLHRREDVTERPVCHVVGSLVAIVQHLPQCPWVRQQLSAAGAHGREPLVHGLRDELL